MKSANTIETLTKTFVGSQTKSTLHKFEYESIYFKFNENGTFEGFMQYETDNTVMKKPICYIENGEWVDKGDIKFSYVLKFENGTSRLYHFSGKLSDSIYNSNNLSIGGTYKRDDDSSNGTWLITEKDLMLRFED